MMLIQPFKRSFETGNVIAKDILESYAKAEFFTKLPEVPEEIKVVISLQKVIFLPIYYLRESSTHVLTVNYTENV
jgi:hypothetical protein